MGRFINTEFFTYLKNVKKVRRTGTGVLMAVDDEFVRVDVIRPDIMRIKVSVAGKFDESPTHAVCAKLPARSMFTLKQTSRAVVLSTKEMSLHVARQNFSLDAFRADGSPIFTSAKGKEGESLAYGYFNNKFVVARNCESRDMFFGLGEKTRSFNRAGQDYMLWNTDIFGPWAHPHELDGLGKDHPDRDARGTTFDPYYMSIPFFYRLPVDRGDSKLAAFFIDNGYKGYFEFSEARIYRYQFCGGQYTEYVFAGPSMKQILEGYTWLTGRMQAPPLWALGYHQCRWYPYDQKSFTKLTDTFREKKIPCDVQWLDIDYMNGYRVFTWDRKRYPDARGMLKRLERQGYRVITIIDPGVKYEKGYPVFDDGVKNELFCRASSGRIFMGKVWPGATAFPNFAKKETRQWWGRLNAEHVKSGLAGIWNDMNEPITFVGEMEEMRFDHDGRQCPHEQYHNQYAMMMAMGTVEGLLKAMPNKRTFVLSRAGFSGIQRYAANWMGDNCSRWSHLAMSIPMAMGLGVSGQPFVGADVGGFAENSNGELLARWIQYAALTPFFRNHNSAKKDQYPWSFGKAVENIYRSAVDLRYRLMPYVYSTFMRASETGDPIQRPLVYDFQEDIATWPIEDQYLFGDSLLVAPVCAAGVTRRNVYLPEGTWYDCHSDESFSGQRFVTAEAPMDYIPLFARGGRVVPMLTEAPQTTMGFQPKSIDLHVFVPREDGTFESMLHEDDGTSFSFRQGKFLRTTFTVVKRGRSLRMTARVTGKGYPEFRRKQFRVVFHGLEAASAVVDGQEMTLSDGALTLDNRGKGFRVAVRT